MYGILVVFGLSFALVEANPFDHSCRVTFSASDGLGTASNEKTATCRSGSVFWNYPQGSIRVVFQNVPNQLCITRGIAASDEYVQSIYNEVEGERQPLSFNTDGRSCFNPDTNSATIVFEGPDRTRHYVSSFSYEVTSPDRSLRERLQATLNDFIHTAIRPFGRFLRKWNIQLDISQS